MSGLLFGPRNSSNFSIIVNNTSSRWYMFPLEAFVGISLEMFEELHYLEQSFIKFHNLYAFMSQINFFLLCESVLENRIITRNTRSLVVALTTVLFYTVFGYFAMKIRDICQKNDAPPSMNTAPSIRSHLKAFCRILIEWLKAVVVVICLREQGINYDPKMHYSIVTFSYYVCTEKVFIEIWPQFIELFGIESLDNLEYLYVPFVLNLLTISAALTLSVPAFLYNYTPYLFILMYFTVYLRLKDIYFNYWLSIVNEIKVNAKFRMATQSDIRKYNDICAVCLNSMSRAKVTPCKHIFHSHCLKRCLKTTFECPLCKRNFLN